MLRTSFIALALVCGPSGSNSTASTMPAETSAAPTAAPDTLPAAEVLPLVAQVDAENAALLRANPGVFTFEPLPFYAGAGLLRATARLPQRPVQFRYVYLRGGENRLLPLGTPDRVQAANAAAGLRLGADAAVAYLRFYLENAGGGRNARRLVADAGEVRWSPITETDPAARDARAQLSERIHPARVEAAGDGGVRVTATTVRGRTLETVTWYVARDGRLQEERATVLAEHAPVVEVL
jgi:hypothetical protein